MSRIIWCLLVCSVSVIASSSSSSSRYSFAEAAQALRVTMPCRFNEDRYRYTLNAAGPYLIEQEKTTIKKSGSVTITRPFNPSKAVMRVQTMGTLRAWLNPEGDRLVTYDKYSRPVVTCVNSQSTVWCASKDLTEVETYARVDDVRTISAHLATILVRSPDKLRLITIGPRLCHVFKGNRTDVNETVVMEIDSTGNTVYAMGTIVDDTQKKIFRTAHTVHDSGIMRPLSAPALVAVDARAQYAPEKGLYAFTRAGRVLLGSLVTPATTSMPGILSGFRKRGTYVGLFLGEKFLIYQTETGCEHAQIDLSCATKSMVWDTNADWVVWGETDAAKKMGTLSVQPTNGWLQKTPRAEQTLKRFKEHLSGPQGARSCCAIM